MQKKKGKIGNKFKKIRKIQKKVKQEINYKKIRNIVEKNIFMIFIKTT